MGWDGMGWDEKRRKNGDGKKVGKYVWTLTRLSRKTLVTVRILLF